MLTTKAVGGMTLGATYSWYALEFDADILTTVKSSDPIWMARASVGVVSKDHGWNASLFVENLTDFKGAISASARGQDVADTEFRARPRTIGIQIGFEL